jgi:hypothetical protein
MKSLIYKVLLTFILVVFTFGAAKSQLKIDVYGGMAVNPVDHPYLLSFGHSPYFMYKNVFAQYSLELNINKRDEKAFNAINTNIGYRFSINENPLDLSLFYCYKPVSTIWNINHTGIKLTYSLKKWFFALGNNFNIYRYKKNAVEVYEITDNHYLLESPNLMYSIKYNFREKGNGLNGYINVSNFETYIIQHEINPMLNVGIIYSKNENWPSIYTDFWYQTAGLNNIRVNYFGFFFRIGASWEI